MEYERDSDLELLEQMMGHGSISGGNSGGQSGGVGVNGVFEYVLLVPFRNQQQLTWCGPAMIDMTLRSLILQNHRLGAEVIHSVDLDELVPTQEEIRANIQRLPLEPDFIHPEGVLPEELAMTMTLYEKRLAERIRRSSSSVVRDVVFEPMEWRVVHWDPEQDGVEVKMSQRLMSIIVKSRRPIVYRSFRGRHYVMCTGFRSTIDPTSSSTPTDSQPTTSSASASTLMKEFRLRAMTILDPLEPDLHEDPTNEWKMRDDCWDEFVTPCSNSDKFKGRCVAIVPALKEDDDND